jgi:hypothetical protein
MLARAAGGFLASQAREFGRLYNPRQVHYNAALF